MALYMSNGESFYRAYLQNHTPPSCSDLQTRNPIQFSDMGGYQLAPTYIQFINDKYGWDKVLQLIKTEDYQKTFGNSDNKIYSEWIEYLKNYYQ